MRIKEENKLLTKIDKTVERVLQLPPTICTGEPTIELFGNKQLIMDGCKGIMEYDEGYIKISGGRYAVIVTGQSLVLKNLTDLSCTITGTIDSVGFGV